MSVRVGTLAAAVWAHSSQDSAAAIIAQAQLLAGVIIDAGAAAKSG
jgi:hypothetical protein